MLSKTDIKAIKDLLNPIETKIGNLQSDMTVVKKDVKNLQSDMTVVKKDVKNLQSDMTVVKKDVKNLQSDMTVVKKDVKKVKKIIETDFGFHENQNIYVIKHVQTIQKNLGLPVMSTVAS